MDKREQASELATKAFAELAKARTFLSMAGDTASDVLHVLNPVVDDADELTKLTQLADEVRSAQKSRPEVQAAVNAVDTKLKEAMDGVDEARGYLQQGGLVVAAGRLFADEIEMLYADQPAETTASERGWDTGTLRARLDGLEKEVKSSTGKLDTAAERLGLMYMNLEPLRRLPDRFGDRAATATLIEDVGARIEPDRTEASIAVEGSSEDLTKASTRAYAAAKVANNVDKGVRAGLNPTNPSSRRTQAAASGDDQPHRPDGSGRNRGLGR